MKMPFGKFEGRLCHETPRYYLLWALENLEISGDLKKAMEMGLEKVEWNPKELQDIEKLMDEICYVFGD